ncbi:hypothetical protein V6N11_016306 [Hibiscus sabdariffa]|uniref:Uncharacterized protein n=1 Tax=Hibiscus sabdariffa TaxID=183260 RepID=A0ABR2TUJ8_9ROSI
MILFHFGFIKYSQGSCELETEMIRETSSRPRKCCLHHIGRRSRNSSFFSYQKGSYTCSIKLIDIPMSNYINSGINKIFVLT